MSREVFKQNEEFTIQGKWWRPGGQYTVYGDLLYRPRNITMNLLGAFDDAKGKNPIAGSRVHDRFDVIHGETAKGTFVTVCNSFYSSLQSNSFFQKQSSTYRTSSMRSHALLIGVHLDSADEKCFQSGSVEIPNFGRWLNDHPYTDNFSGTSKSFSITYTPVETRAFQLSEELGRIEFVHLACPNGIWEDGTITHSLRLKIIPTQPQSYDWYLTTLRSLERLFRLVAGPPLESTRLTLFCSDDPLDDGTDVFIPCSRSEIRELNPIDFLIRFPEIEPYWPTILSNWFTSSEKIRHALDLVFSSLEQPAAFMEAEFLPFVQAAEVYARAINHGTVVSKSEYKALRQVLEKAIPDGTNEELKDAIKASLSYANERNLRLRLIQLLDELEPKTRDLFCVDHKKFVKGIVDTRNFFTHYSSGKKKILRQAELHWATEKLKNMLTVLLLHYYGLPESEIQKLLGKDHNWNQKRKYWKTVSEEGRSSDEGRDEPVE